MIVAHLRPTAPIAPDALLPGDPGRALLLAQELLAEPKMSNHSRGLWGYYGETESGRPLTIQSTGIGGPSAAIVLGELAELGVRRAVRVGTCGALEPETAVGELLAVESALAMDGVGGLLGSEALARPDAALAAALAAAASAAGGHPAQVVSTDLFQAPDGVKPPQAANSGAAAVEMECAALFALAQRLGVAAGALLVISRDESGEWIAPERLEERAKVMGRTALAALEDEG
jgi:uridine phosphorylase